MLEKIEQLVSLKLYQDMLKHPFAQLKFSFTFAVLKIGSLAQLVQSICLTSRGSGVRTPQLPQSLRFLRLFYCILTIRFPLVYKLSINFLQMLNFLL
jgi:hypothetical protein